MSVKLEKFMLNGVEYKTQLTQKWINRKKWEEPNPYLLTSHIPGTIMHIEVKEGQAVEEGESLLILQAMKMNNQLTAPFSGKIKKICVNVGDKIPKGALMIEMEENEYDSMCWRKHASTFIIYTYYHEFFCCRTHYQKLRQSPGSG